MFIDICFPKGNEELFIKRARELGTQSILFVYRDGMHQAPYGALRGSPAARKATLVLGSGSRAIFEDPRVHMIYGQEKISPKDSVHAIKSGMNEVLARILTKKEKSYGICVSDIIHSPNLTGRFRQNVKLCEDFNVPMVLASFAVTPEDMRSAEDLAYLGKFLGIEKPSIAIKNLNAYLGKGATE